MAFAAAAIVGTVRPQSVPSLVLACPRIQQASYEDRDLGEGRDAGIEVKQGLGATWRKGSMTVPV